MHGTALILGGSGRFGRHAAEAFWNRGWRVRLFERGRDDLAAAASGADVIVNGWNPPYDRWAREVPGLTRAVIAAARATGATVILPGNVYVFGADAPETLTADTPHTARNPLGRIRVEMEASYRAAGVRTIVLRAGDFIDTEASGNWFDRVIAADLGRGRLTYPGCPDVPHAWAYLPDLAEAAVALAWRRDGLPAFADIPFPGHTLTGRDLADAAARVTGRTVSVARMNWLPLQIARPVWPMARHLQEMRYLWSMPHRLDGARFGALLPDFRPTALDDALRSALGQIDPYQPVARPARAAAA